LDYTQSLLEALETPHLNEAELRIQEELLREELMNKIDLDNLERQSRQEIFLGQLQQWSKKDMEELYSCHQEQRMALVNNSLL
jgi:hypothetical protein